MKSASIHVRVNEIWKGCHWCQRSGTVEDNENPTRVGDHNTGEVDEWGNSVYQMCYYHDLQM